jgi:hypothetical protein
MAGFDGRSETSFLGKRSYSSMQERGHRLKKLEKALNHKGSWPFLLWKDL